MARKLNMAFLVAMAIATLVQISTAQTTTVHVVADAMGWIVPPGGATAYSTWAANNTFRVGDILVFNFATGRHDVAEVSKAAFDACNTASPISRDTNSPANITLSSAGEHYYICTFTGHCGGGQKLAVNVTSGASSPAPQPATPSPVPTPTPPPTSSAPPAQTPAPAPASTPTSSPPPTPTPTSSPPPTPTPTSSSPPSSSASPPSPTTNTTPSSPSPNGATPPSPAGSSAKSLGVALSSTFLAIFVAFLY